MLPHVWSFLSSTSIALTSPPLCPHLPQATWVCGTYPSSTQSSEEDHAAAISFGPLKISVAGSASVAGWNG